MNDCLQANDGYTPKGENWFGMGNVGTTYDTYFDNEGNRIEVEERIYDEEKNYRRVYVKRMKKVFPWQHIYTVYYAQGKDFSYNDIKLSEKVPNLYEVKRQNHLGNNAKSATYIALPEKTTNIRMIRGNGVIDCGKYKFIYADRYVTADESIHAECTFNLEE